MGYSAVNSPGYSAESGDWAVVGMFLLVAAGACGSFAVLWKRDVGTASRTLDESEPRARIGPAGAAAGGRS